MISILPSKNNERELREHEARDVGDEHIIDRLTPMASTEVGRLQGFPGHRSFLNFSFHFTCFLASQDGGFII
jgi:hypothetical protein